MKLNKYKSKDMTQEEIKETWRKAARQYFIPPADELERMYREKKETALEKLAAKYRRFSIFGLVMGFACSGYLLPNSIFDKNLRIWIYIIFATYFFTCSIMDYWLYKGVKGIDCYTMSVKEVAERAMYYRRRHIQFIAILLPVAFGIIGFIIYAAGANKYLVAGLACGVIIGECLGLRNYFEFMDEYKKIRD